MQRDVQALDIVCKHFEQYRSDELTELRREIQRLKRELIHLRIRLIINGAVLKEWLQFQRRVQNLDL